MTHRWPLHPAPGQGEALTSWLHRLATVYGMNFDQLVSRDLTPPGVLMPSRLRSLDLEAPSDLITTVAERTGVPEKRVHRMTVAGWVPWLLDSLQPEEIPRSSYQTYVRQDSVLFTFKERPYREVLDWRAWLPLHSKERRVSRVCPVCVESTTDNSFVLTLIAQLPITLTCPHHGCRLAPAFGPYEFVGWENNKINKRPALGQIIIQDARTEEALTTGKVTLPRRTIHVGVWFRLLRTVIEEISTTLSNLRVRPRRMIELIWREAGHPVRAGIIGAARTYESLSWPQQEMLLEAAATAMQLVEAGKIEAHGTLGHLLTREPDRTVHDGAPSRGLWDGAHAAADECLVRAQQDPLVAEKVLATLTSLTRSEHSFQRIRSDLIALDIPEEFLPRTLATVRAI
ncbi:TniQ family protein [Glutamicibacter sp. 0426]|uniref:TniQ family protein n=1 Tax=Glutamicibacter sp. 0426 TaxID=1913445 RepID=UPI00093CBDDF|nr:TniQ family protein [Glutamicibacter sp. 0426]